MKNAKKITEKFNIYQNTFQRTKGQRISIGDSRMLKDRERWLIDKTVESQELNVFFILQKKDEGVGGGMGEI